MLEFFNELARNTLNALSEGTWGALLGLFFVSGLTEVGIPFPFIVDSILIITGIQKDILSMKVGMIMLSLLAGRLVGASIIYWLTRLVGKVFINWVGRRFPFLQRRLDWLTAKLSRRAPIAVAIARLTPGLLTPSTVAAGVIRLRYSYLLLGIAISSVIADISLLLLGFTTGKGLEQFGLKQNVWLIIIIVIVIIGIGWLVGWRLSRKTPRV
jgi:membrane protein DedA with SNARE-associated domain